MVQHQMMCLWSPSSGAGGGGGGGRRGRSTQVRASTRVRAPSELLMVVHRLGRGPAQERTW
jgi:hypothetical protein